MDFLNRALSQIGDIYRSMTPAVRGVAALLLILLCVSLGFLFQAPWSTGDEYLLAGRPFSSAELTAAQRAFAEAGLKQFEVEGNRLKIPRGKKDVYIAALAEHNAIPADFYSYLNKALAGDNPFVSNRTTELRLKAAKEQQLALMIKRFRGISEASVVFSEEETPGLRRKKERTATVAVETTGGVLDDDRIKAIRDFVCFSYAGLSAKKVSIVDTTAGMSHVSPDEDMSSGSDNLYALTKSRFEADWRAKIQDKLKYIQGVLVGVNVELDPDMRLDQSTLKYGEKPVTLRSNEIESESTSKQPEVGGAVGARANGVNEGFRGNQPVSVSSTSSSTASSQKTERRSDQQSLVGHEQTHSRKAPLVPRHVTASIDIPASHFVRVWQKQNPTPVGQTPKTPDPADLKRIESEVRKNVEEAVVQLLPPVPLGKDPYPQIKVTTFEDVPLAAIPPPAFTSQATDWLSDNWQTLAMLGLGCVSLFMVRGLIRGAGPEPKSAEEPKPKESPQEAPVSIPMTTPESAESTLSQRRRLQSRGPNLREELRELVNEDPDAAANVLRAWIGDVA